MRKYSDYFSVPEDYRPVMTREIINEQPDRWLDFFPHTDFEDICNTLLAVLKSGARSLWITGNYGTGKSNASLVIQKLFMDDEIRVRQWFANYASSGLSDRESLENKLFERRDEGTLVIYDYDASSIGASDGLLVRLEKSIIAALAERNLSIPSRSNLDLIIDRVRREGANFFTTRDSLQNQLAYLDSSIKTVEDLIKSLDNSSVSSKLVDDIETVLRKDSIYLDLGVPTFRSWIKAVLSENNLHRIVYLFDEFHPFIEANKEQLKTFEDVTESPGVNRFFLIPVTHMDINAYLAEGSSSAKKANDRFYFRKIQMPNDTAFRLAKHAMIDIEDEAIADEWRKTKNDLWDSVSTVVDQFNSTGDPERARFYDILPIHPMAAFLLKHLSEQAKSNQRSFFEYLKGGADSTEFQDFIRTGGPQTAHKQFLTVDYLWKYFIDRSDLGLHREITEIGTFYQQTRNRVFANQTENAPELRILKAVLLFSLLDKLAPGGHDRLKPTVENIELSFRGDGAIANPCEIVEELEREHCFSITNGNISLFTVSSVKEEDIEKYRDRFHELLHEKLEAALEEHTKNYRKYNSGRFDIRVSDVSHTSLTYINQATRDKYSENLNKDDGSVCLWFVVAKDRAEQMQVHEKIKSMLQNLYDHRILMFAFTKLPFCYQTEDNWNNYIRQYAQYMAENDSAAKKQIHDTLERIENEWFAKLQEIDSEIRVYRYRNENVEYFLTKWNLFKDLITDYAREKLKFSVDRLGFTDTHFGNSALKAYAKAGITFQGSTSPLCNFIKTLKDGGVSESAEWFENNPDHPLGAIHALFEKKFSNTVERGGQQSIRKIYIELKRAPYGLRYNALSAFVLGFCLRDTLHKNYRWTNGQIGGDLDTEVLAEIIEMVIKDDGDDKLGSKEKEICRLSKEEKEFVLKIPVMFNVEAINNATVENVLSQVQNSIEVESAKVPLWVLPEFIFSQGDPKAETIKKVIDGIGTAFFTSSKGNIDEKVVAIREVGSILLSDPDIVENIAVHLNKAKFIKAFEYYVDKAKPQLAHLAINIGDFSHDYCKSILERCQETASWLWRQADISREIEDVFCEYEIISLAMPLFGYEDFVSYKYVLDALKNAIMENNHLPQQTIESFHPTLTSFFAALQSTGLPHDIKSALQHSFGTIQQLFFDPSKQETLAILKSKLNCEPLDNSDLLEILNEMDGGFGLDENTFFSKFGIKIEEFAKRSVVLNIKNEWIRISGSETPDEWAFNNGVPARYLLGNHPHTTDLLRAINHPETFASAVLSNLLESIRAIEPISIAKCQRALNDDILPERYKKFQISIAALLGFLRDEHGNQPNNWPLSPDISEFLTNQYKTTFAPQIKEKLRSKSAESIKEKLLSLASDNPELGIIFWED